MVKLYFVIALFLITGCKHKLPADSSNVHQSDDQIINPNLINNFSPSNDYIDSLIEFIGLKTVSKFQIVENSDTAFIYLRQLPNWNDPGDFINIQVEDKRGNILFDKTNIDGWVKFGNNYSVPESVKKLNLLNSDEVLLVNNYSGKQLILFGWVYASKPGLMTIIDIFPRPKVIFNRNFEIKSIQHIDDYLIITGDTIFSHKTKLNTRIMRFQ